MSARGLLDDLTSGTMVVMCPAFDAGNAAKAPTSLGPFQTSTPCCMAVHQLAATSAASSVVTLHTLELVTWPKRSSIKMR